LEERLVADESGTARWRASFHHQEVQLRPISSLGTLSSLLFSPYLIQERYWGGLLEAAVKVEARFSTRTSINFFCKSIVIFVHKRCSMKILAEIYVFNVYTPAGYLHFYN
jgi:hypothetical protein